MTWEEQLFGLLDDLEQQAESLYAAELDLELADRARAEYQHVSLAARLMASVGSSLVLDVVGVGPLRGELGRVAERWCLLSTPGRDWVVALSAVASVAGASERAVPALAWSPLARLGLGSVLRRLAAAGEPCVVRRIDGGCHEGVLDRVGENFVEVLEGEGAGARRSLVALSSIAAVASPEIE